MMVSTFSTKLEERANDLPGLKQISAEVFLEELRHSLAYERLTNAIRNRETPPQLRHPVGIAWDPRSGIVAWDQLGDKEEATWLAFLSTIIGPDDVGDPWVSVRNLYSGFGSGQLYWNTVLANPMRVAELRAEHPMDFKTIKFGNHRQHEHQEQLELIISSYVRLVKRESAGSQKEMILGNGKSPRPSFHDLMQWLDRGIFRFGRLGCFDFLCLLGNLGVYDLTPDRLYLEGATGPLHGASLLFGTATPAELDRRSRDLAVELGVSIQVMEDTLCNWQKHR